MKPENITKLYKGLTDSEKASLTFTFMMQTDYLETARIAGAVEMVAYRGLSIDYRNSLQDILALASTWGLIYWQKSSALMASLAMSYAIMAGLSDDDHTETQARVMVLKRQALAIDHALTQLCEDYGLTREAILKYAGVEVLGEMFDGVESDTSYQAEIYDQLSQILTRYN